MKKQQHYLSALSFLSTYHSALSHLETLTRSQLFPLFKSPSTLKKIQNYDEQSKYHRLKSYKLLKEKRVDDFNNMLFRRYLPRLRFGRGEKEVMEELEEGIRRLEREVQGKEIMKKQ